MGGKNEQKLEVSSLASYYLCKKQAIAAHTQRGNTQSHGDRQVWIPGSCL